MLNLELETRRDFTREGLVDMLLRIFSDEDTSNANGENYITDAAKDAGFKTVDEYHRAKWSAFKGTEIDLVQMAFEDYHATLENYYDEASYAFARNSDGKITTIALAGCFD